jgi:DNA polymerase alpha-associated DNA helicase A
MPLADEGAAAGCDMFERSDSDDLRSSDSKFNENEAVIVERHVALLVQAGLDPSAISVISPYQAQVALLSRALKERYVGIECGSVDGFQGRENEVVIVSLVRSNDQREVGFLRDHRRLNVAMTRPKRQLVVVGDSETVSKGSAFLKGWMAYLEEHADLRPADMLDL